MSHMFHRLSLSAVTVLIGAVAISAQEGAQKPTTPPAHHLTKQARLAAIRRAQVWKATDIPMMDLKAGPQGTGAIQPNETVTCDWVDKKMTGNTPKFTCAITKDDEVKVKYGADNGEVYGEVGATRLLWALGFGADRMYPVRVVCRGCSSDPFKDHKEHRDQVVFDPAAIERKMHGHTLETKEDEGWAWPELDLVDEAAGGAPRAHRDALKLLAVFIQHTDSKAQQQRLSCLSEMKEAEECQEPFMMLNDVGVTFGHANMFNRGSVGSVNFDQWSHAKVWADAKTCIGSLSQSQTGTLGNPSITEAGRKFLADLLVQLSDAQLRDLFDVARFPTRAKSVGAKQGLTVDEWVDLFKRKRDEVVNRTCP